MRVTAFAHLVLVAGLIGCDRPPAASPAGGPNPTASPGVTSSADIDEPGVQIDAPGMQLDIGGNGVNGDERIDDEPIDGDRRRRLRLPNVDVDVNRTPGGGTDVDVDIDRRDESVP